MSGWKTMKTAPRDGREMLVRTISRSAWGDVQRGYDIAVWVGKAYDSTGRFSSRSGDICTHWMPLNPPDDET